MTDSLNAASKAVADAVAVIEAATTHLARQSEANGKISVAQLDQHQVLAYDLAHVTSALEGCRVMLDYAEKGEYESMLARAFIADAIWDLGSRIIGRESEWGVSLRDLFDAFSFVEAHRSPEFLESIADQL
ncbi:MAG: acyl-CoA dehydrogenase, partial [Actinobacteria bacterium]|nr:acyl-CoA dehydrogenase [Actinomycetota bacterium]